MARPILPAAIFKVALNTERILKVAASQALAAC